MELSINESNMLFLYIYVKTVTMSILFNDEKMTMLNWKYVCFSGYSYIQKCLTGQYTKSPLEESLNILCSVRTALAKLPGIKA